MTLNSKKVKLINLIINTYSSKVLKRLEGVYEDELSLRWFEGGVVSNGDNVKKEAGEVDKDGHIS